MKRYRIKRGVSAIKAASKEEASRFAGVRGTKHIHISEIDVDDLREMLSNVGIEVSTMPDADIRIACIRRYGSWYMVKQ